MGVATTRPRLLVEEATHALVFENFYAHVPRTSFSFMALNFSIYPGMPWNYARVETFERDGARKLPQTLASVLRQRGARTAYLHNGDLEWAGMRAPPRKSGLRHDRGLPSNGRRYPDFLWDRG